MKQLLLFETLLFLLLLHQPSAHAQLLLKDTIKLGPVTRGEIATFTSRLHNQFSEDVIIKGLKATCDSTKSKPNEWVLSPGQETTVDIVFAGLGITGRIEAERTGINRRPFFYRDSNCAQAVEYCGAKQATGSGVCG